MNSRRRQPKKPKPIQVQTPALILLSHSTFVDSIYPHLSVPDILNLHFVCSQVHDAVRNWLPAGYNIEHHFGRYFDDPLSFRVLQAQTGTIVSGSNALQFFERSYYPESDIDLYVPCRHTSAVAKWVLMNGYSFNPSEKQLVSLQTTTPAAFFDDISQRRITIHDGQPTVSSEDYGWSAVEDVLTFIHMSKPGRKVQLIVVDPQSSPVACILYFHSTLVMNFIAWDKAYCLFPAATFLTRSCLTFGDVKKDPRLLGIYAKYWARGFKISAVPAIAPIYPKVFVFGHRWTNDKHSWVIDFHTEEVLRLAMEADGGGNPHGAYRAGGGGGGGVIAGFSLETQALGDQWVAGIRRNPDRCRYLGGAPAIYWEEVKSPVLTSALVLPFSRTTRLFWRIKDWLKAQEGFEKAEAKAMNPELTLELIPHSKGWKYWDQEVLNMVLLRAEEMKHV